MSFRRVTSAWPTRLPSITCSWSRPSTRYRIRRQRSSGSMWMSDAFTSTASWNIDWISLMTGASGEPSSAASAWRSTSVSLSSSSSSSAQRHDLVRAPVDEVDRAQQRRFFREREPHRLAEQARQLVEREQVGRVRHADEIAARVFLQHERAMAARVVLRQLRHDFRVQLHVRKVDERNVQVGREAGVQIRLGNGADVDQHAAELAAAHALLRERVLQLLLGDQLLLEQQIAEPDAFFALRGHVS